MTTQAVQTIPWTYTDQRGVLLWTWRTEHFVARVSGQEVENPDGPPGARIIRSYNWDVSDLIKLNQGMPRMLIEGMSSTFDEAENSVREHVGKCYDSRLGYRPFSGPFATRYFLSTGEEVNVQPYLNTKCAVTVLLPDRSERTVVGSFTANGYRWRLTTGDAVLEIVPEHVVAISNRSAAAERAAQAMDNDLYSGIGRIYREDPKRGCTGRPGYTVGTVDHAGAPRCPLHESDVPDHLLR